MISEPLRKYLWLVLVCLDLVSCTPCLLVIDGLAKTDWKTQTESLPNLAEAC